MKPNCERCGCEDLDMGVSRQCRCTKCGHIQYLMGKWYASIPDVENLK